MKFFAVSVCVWAWAHTHTHTYMCVCVCVCVCICAWKQTFCLMLASTEKKHYNLNLIVIKYWHIAQHSHPKSKLSIVNFSFYSILCYSIKSPYKSQQDIKFSYVLNWPKQWPWPFSCVTHCTAYVHNYNTHWNINPMVVITILLVWFWAYIQLSIYHRCCVKHQDCSQLSAWLAICSCKMLW